MPVTNIAIVKTNFDGDCRILAAQSELYFEFDATYSGITPDYLIVEMTIDGVSYITGKAIYLKDISNNKRRFIFEASDFIRALISDNIDDFEQGDGSIIETSISQIITVVVKSDLAGTISETFQFEAMNAVRQADESVAMIDIYNNQEEDYIAIEGEPCYIYFYGDEVLQETFYALDYNNDNFVDYNDEKFIID